MKSICSTFALMWLIFASLVAITGLPLIQSAVSMLLDSKNAATASKPNLICTTNILNDRNYSEHVLYTHTLTTNNKHQHWDLILCCCSCIKCVHCPWFEQFGCLCLEYCAWAGFGGFEEQEDKLHACYCSRAIQHGMWYVHTLLTCYLWVSHEISWATRMQVSS